MGFQSLTLFVTTISLISSSPVVFSQQAYMGNNRDCSITNKTTTVFGYICNNQHPSCQTYLIFRSRPSFDSVYSISNLLSSDLFQISQLNSLGHNYYETIQTEKEVIVPVKCSCSGEYYQANSSYVVGHGNTQFAIANYIYQGLTTCHALLQQRTTVSRVLYTGTNLTIPLRCACPTSNQISNGVKNLLTYPVLMTTDSILSISKKFGVDTQSILDANELTEVNSALYLNTTLLIPLKNKPSINQTILPPPPPPRAKSLTSKWAYAVIGFAIGSFITAIGFHFLSNKVRKSGPIVTTRDSETSERPRTNSTVAKEIYQVLPDISHTLKVYKFEELQLATEDFCTESLIRGSVYRGLINQNVVAIKKIGRDVSKEIGALKSIHHFNLLQLLGVSFSQGYWYLVSEFAERGSLSEWICQGSSSTALSWTQRLKIALDVAYGLHYLHSYTEPAYIHKDITSSNILLDRDFRAKIANFAKVKTMEDREGGFALTEHVVGTMGYMAPEYLENGLVSPKLDVYAFGIVMLEIITGQEAVIEFEEGGGMFLSEALMGVLREGNAKEKLKDLIDPSLQGNYPLDLAFMLARLIQGCLRKDPSSRPSMDGIVQSLSNILATSLTWELSSSLLELLTNGNCDVEHIHNEIGVFAENGDGTYGS